MIYIIADDLTGACDTGACFAQRGLRTWVQIDPAASGATPNSGADVLVFNTLSRALSQPLAVQAVQQVARQITQADALVYKKIDSTLRGHPGTELHALMQTLGVERALVTPAFPAQGRTVTGGQVFIHGTPLSQTVFASEGAVGDLPAVFAHAHYPLHVLTQPTAPEARKLLQSPGIVLADAQTDDDLRRLAQLACECHVRLLCGSAGFATALAQNVDLSQAEPLSTPASHGAILGVAGSRNPSTAGQVRHAEQHGITILQPPPKWIGCANSRPPEAVVEAICATLAGAGRALLSTCALPESTLGREQVAERLGEIVALVARRMPLHRLVLTGGDVAIAVCRALEAHWLMLHGEAQPGIAQGQLADGPYAGVGVITKAGGFGAEDALTRYLLG